MIAVAMSNEGPPDSGEEAVGKRRLRLVDDDGDLRPAEPWKILVVDDERDVHRLVRLICRDLEFEGHGVEFIDAYTGAEARKALTDAPDTALVVLDVMMETASAGLDFIDHVRGNLGESGLQIVLLTGQPGLAPEQTVIRDYEINAYVNKADIASQSMKSAVITALRAHSDHRKLAAMARYRSKQAQLLRERNEALIRANASLEVSLAARSVLERELQDVESEVENRIREQVAARTHRLAMEKERAEMATKAKSEQIASVIHDLRNPLQTIIGLTDLLLMDADSSRTQEETDSIADINRASQHMLALVERNLTDTAAEGNVFEAELSAFDAGPVLQDALEMSRIIAHEHDVTMEAEIDASLPAVFANRTQLLQVLLNLLSNGAKYNRPGGTVRLEARQRDGQVEVRVADTGIGIPEALHHRLFRPFDRLGAEAREEVGTGIGLVITRKLLEAQGSAIEFESIEGEGTTFRFRLQVATETADA